MSEPRSRVHDTSDQRRAQAFFDSPNNFAVGGIRINLAGREEAGQVEPGGPLDELCRRLEEDLLALVNVETGSTVVNRVRRSDEIYERRSLDALPDLFVEWNQDHPIETVWSPRVGMIHAPYTHWRTGDHRPGGQLLVLSPRVQAGAELAPIDVQRLSGAILAELGVAGEGAEPAPPLSVAA